tara:strand:- start:2912 stop:3082 length:171 start_codon:yes stop_codon:yes gene_type:complete
MLLDSLKAELREARYAMQNAHTRKDAQKHSEWYQKVKDRIAAEEAKIDTSVSMSKL